MQKTLRMISKTLSTAVLVVVVLLAVFLGGIRLVGLTPYTVLSGSMEPTYHVGSVVYIKKVNPADLKAGDAITYRLTGNTVVTHRIEEVLNPGTPNLAFRTKGDANEDADIGAPISPNAIVGKATFSIPYLGFISAFIQTPKGLFLTIGTCGGVLLISFLTEQLLEKPKEKAAASETDDSEENNG